MGNSLYPAYVHFNDYLNPDQPFGPNYTGPFIHPTIKDFKKDVEEKYQNFALIEELMEAMEIYKNNDCLGYRKLLPEGKFENKYTYFNYQEVKEMSYKCSRNIHEKINELCYFETYNNIDLKLIGIFAKNCVEWVVTDIACQLDSITTVTLYATLGLDSFRHICEQTQIKTIFLSPDVVDLFCDFKQKLDLQTVKTIILFDFTVNAKDEQFEKLKNLGFTVYSFKNDFLKENTAIKNEELTMSKPDTLHTICYTSGTTSKPKGAMIDQRNLYTAQFGCVISSGITFSNPGVKRFHFSYLPLAHVFERMVVFAFLSRGGKIGFLSGTVKTTLTEDIKLVEPIMLVAVPKVIQTLRGKIFEQVKKMPSAVQKIFYKAFEIKKRNYEKYGVIKHALYDKIVFGKIKKMFGRNIDHILCASAPLPKDVATDIKVLLSIPIVEGWGMTELGGSAMASNFDENLNLTQGGVSTTCLIKLVDVPELGYTKDSTKDGISTPSGEICVKGPLVFKGYYKNEEETKKTLDDEGYLHSGDVGSLLPNLGNGIKLVDRVKEIFKLSQGEYIIPAKLEAIYSKSPYVEQMMIYGNSYKNNIIAIICPNWKNCGEFLGVDKSADREEMVKNPNLYNEIKRNLLDLATKANFNSLEKINYFILTAKGFTIENGCVNPTMKVVRKRVETVFKDEIDRLYDSI